MDIRVEQYLLDENQMSKIFCSCSVKIIDPAGKDRPKFLMICYLQDFYLEGGLFGLHAIAYAYSWGMHTWPSNIYLFSTFPGILA